MNHYKTWRAATSGAHSCRLYLRVRHDAPVSSTAKLSLNAEPRASDTLAGVDTATQVEGTPEKRTIAAIGQWRDSPWRNHSPGTICGLPSTYLLTASPSSGGVQRLRESGLPPTDARTTRAPRSISVMDPLAPFSRNEPCWCGSAKKYKKCHGVHHPPSQPGEPLPPDREDGSFFVSPTVTFAKDALSFPDEGIDLHIPTGRPEARPIQVDLLAERVAAAGSPALSPKAPSAEALGNLRVVLLREMRQSLRRGRQALPIDLRDGVAEVASATLATVGSLASIDPRPVVLWNDELDPGQFIGRTLMLADHVLVPDPVFDAASRGASPAELLEAVEALLIYGPLIETGHIIPVPPTVALAFAGGSAVDLTKIDVANRDLVDWVRSQLIIEGPTAREMLFFRAVDDTDPAGYPRILGHNVRSDASSRTFTTRMFGNYDAGYDYGPWIEQTTNDAIAYFIQRLNERAVTGDAFGATYVTASPFEARILKRKRHQFDEPAEAAVWSQVPYLPDANPNTLAKALRNDSAVEDFRAQARAALVTARSLDQRADALTAKVAELEVASRALEKTLHSDKAWQGLIPGACVTGSIALGGLGTVPAAVAGTIGILGALSPYLGARAAQKRSAAYLFVGLRRAAGAKR